MITLAPCFGSFNSFSLVLMWNLLYNVTYRVLQHLINSSQFCLPCSHTMAPRSNLHWVAELVFLVFLLDFKDGIAIPSFAISHSLWIISTMKLPLPLFHWTLVKMSLLGTQTAFFNHVLLPVCHFMHRFLTYITQSCEYMLNQVNTWHQWRKLLVIWNSVHRKGNTKNNKQDSSFC